MKREKHSFTIRLLAFVMLVPFAAVNCSAPVLPDPDAKKPWPGGTGEAIEKPVSFYLSDDYQPSPEDTGKTAFMLPGNENFVITSEEMGNSETVGRFLSGEKETGVSIYFDGTNAFPRGFVLTDETDTAYGIFSPYNTETQVVS